MAKIKEQAPSEGRDRDTLLWKILRYIFLSLSILFVIIPIIPLIFMSFKTGVEVKTTGYFTPPTNWLNFFNFKQVWVVGGLGSSLITTAEVMIVGITLSVIMCCMAGYIFQRFDFKLKKPIFTMYLLTMFIPAVSSSVIIFNLMYKVHLVGKVPSLYILYSGADIISIYIVMNLLKTIPKELDEAGLMDGAGMFRTFFSIVLPLMKPAMATLAVLKGIGIYNDFYTPNLYLLGGATHRTLTLAMYKFFQGLSTPFEQLSAASLMGIIPVLVLFLLLQKYIYSAVGGAVKG